MGLVAAGVGLAVAGAGSVISSSSARKASDKASAIAANTAKDNNAVALDIYGQNKATLAPYVSSGVAANGQINALLGLGGTPAQPAVPASGPMSGARFIDSASAFGGGFGAFGGPGGFYGAAPQTPGRPAIPGQTSQQAASAAFDQFRNSTGYQFRLGEGNRGINSAYAGAGTIKSGDAMRAIAGYNQDYASNEFGNYMNQLSNQQGVGLSGASAQAGVANNYGNSVQANNNSAGTAAANNAINKGNNSFGNTLGLLGGGLFKYGTGS